MSRTSVEDILAAGRAIVDQAEQEDRDLTNDEVAAYEELEAQLTAARRTREVRARQDAYETPVRDDPPPVAQGEPAAPGHPLAYTAAAIDQLRDLARRRVAGRVDAASITNVTLTTGETGARRDWGSNALAGPRMLHVAAGVPRQSADSIFAEFPQLTLPAPSPAAGEGLALVEYDASVGGSVTLARFGRFTTLTAESRLSADATPAIIGAQTVGIARDLDNVLIGALEAEVPSPIAAGGDTPGVTRRAIAEVVDATAGSVAGTVVLANPAEVALLQDVQPTGGETVGEPFPLFSGALVYPSSSVTSPVITVAAVRSTVRYFVAEDLASMTDVPDLTTEELVIATKVTAGYAVNLTGGVQRIDTSL